ncbi:Outer membrane efflux protein BepC precursor [Shimia thalassica]|uniref:Outer membrane efflux protein BepC n=2 Tax=Shimia thalassica TaxID=1715693 RepID=A0A0P1IAT5_9RHOB|nr:Outer membrane efflux protein BepC precursor [Shimia thalassica]
MLKKIPAVIFFMATAMGPNISSALSLEDSILYVLETNPEIKAAESNKQAIEFELEQARNFYSPKFELEAWAGTSENRGNASPDLGAASGSVEGYELTARVSQMLFDGYRTRSEIERQAYRIDAAAYRVLERSEVLSLEAVRLYSDVLRTRSLLSLAQRNYTYHKDVYARLKTGYDRGVIGIGDLQQGEERVYLAEDIILEFELNAEDAETLFLETVGVEPKSLQTLPSVSRAVPSSLDLALGRTRTDNPTIKFMQSDVGSAEALSRRANSNRYPSFHLEAEGRTGEDVGGFLGDREDFRVGLVLRYEFQGTRKRAVRQEQARRVNESKSHLLSRTRRVESEVRQSWSTLRSAKRRLSTIQGQARLSRQLREAYENEFVVGNRSLLDVLNTQGALFQAEANLINARSLTTYAEYRLLASVGILLPTLGIKAPEDAKPYAGEKVGAPGLSEASSEQQFDAKTFRQWRQSVEK